ncbi:uncharacterized protein F4822DRAFT_261210 [Hypoxylon trugodes]|uniref:uncharacterized protein n=1 Tax=Hypoxylon trugodes TaxID=326681 RepID=UPI00219394C6|nr:uncharacterized protein F4822DRAFT_261210 [Hypoxylon trugodes]KAI1388880.1 hypothetical protein F4822DRAFT_261210 [Hypoxylon trugodes]
MAIIAEIPGVEVTVRIAGEVAEEHDGPKATDRKIKESVLKTCNMFIECRDNTPFAIHLKVDNDYRWGRKNHSLNIATYIDGQWAKGHYCRQWDVHRGPWECDVSYRIVRNERGELEQQSFQFASIAASGGLDFDQYQRDLKKVQQMGTIEVKIYRVIEDDSDDANSHSKVPGVGITGTTISKKALDGKTVSHGTRYANVTPATRKPRYVGCTTLPEDDGPIATFRFLYRSKDNLNAILRRLKAVNPVIEALKEKGTPPPSAQRPHISPQAARRPHLAPPGAHSLPSRLRLSEPEDGVQTPPALASLSRDEIEKLAIEGLRQQRTSWVDEAIKNTVGPPGSKDEEKRGLEKEQRGRKRTLSEPSSLVIRSRPYKMSKTDDGKDIIHLDDD